MFPVKEEYPCGSSSLSPRPIEGLHEAGPPPFLSKTFEMVDDLSIDRIVSWSRGGCSFVVWDPHEFSTSVLPKYFKHNNFSSFVRQLNTYVLNVERFLKLQIKPLHILNNLTLSRYTQETIQSIFFSPLQGFRKIDPDKWEFSNESFLKGQKHLLRNIRRKKTPSQTLLPNQQESDPCVEVGRFGLDGEIERLRRDKQVLVAELIKIRQQQQCSRDDLKKMELRLRCTERKQQQMMSFLARAVQNPEFVNQLVQHKHKNKKRRMPTERCESIGVGLGVVPVNSEPTELEALALEMQGFGRDNHIRDFEDERDEVRLEVYERDLDDGFWEELFNEGGEEDVSFLADRFGFLGSSSK